MADDWIVLVECEQFCQNLAKHRFSGEHVCDIRLEAGEGVVRLFSRQTPEWYWKEQCVLCGWHGRTDCEMKFKVDVWSWSSDVLKQQ